VVSLTDTFENRRLFEIRVAFGAFGSRSRSSAFFSAVFLFVPRFEDFADLSIEWISEEYCDGSSQSCD
jgi:hypothetical protein